MCSYAVMKIFLCTFFTICNYIKVPIIQILLSHIYYKNNLSKHIPKVDIVNYISSYIQKLQRLDLEDVCPGIGFFKADEVQQVQILKQ